MPSLPDWLSGRFEVAALHGSYVLDNHPTQHAAVAAAFAFASIVTLVVVAWRTPGRLVPPIVAVLASLPIVVGVIASGWSPSGGERAARVVFSSPLRVSIVALAIGASGLVVSALAMILRQSGHMTLVPYAIATFALGLVTAGLADRARDVAHYDDLPVLALSGATEGHVGREWDIPVQLEAPSNRYWFFGWHGGGLAPLSLERRALWDAPATLHVHPTKLGKNDVTIEARRGRVTVRSEATIEAHRERASPLLGLRVGDHYVYDVVTRGSDGSFFFVVPLRGGNRTSTSELEISVIGTRERGPFRTFVLEVKSGKSISFSEVAAVDGRTEFFDPDTGKLFDDAVAFMDVGDAPNPDPLPCSFHLFGMAQAVCQRGQFSRPAPMTFVQGTGSTVDSIATGFVALITAGILILPSGGSATYGLSHTDAGPVGAPEALPE